MQRRISIILPGLDERYLDVLLAPRLDQIGNILGLRQQRQVWHPTSLAFRSCPLLLDRSFISRHDARPQLGPGATVTVRETIESNPLPRQHDESQALDEQAAAAPASPRVIVPR